MASAMHQIQSFGSSMIGTAGREDLKHRKELLWKDFFKDPSIWWDNRSCKRSSGQPDFTHKVTKEPLWMDSPHNPSWLSEELRKTGLTVEDQCIGMVNNPSAEDGHAFSPSLIWACCKNKDLSKGTRLHIELKDRGLAEEDYSDALVTMYANCGELQKAQALLDIHKSNNILPWNALIVGYNRQGQGQNALDCFNQMQQEGIPPNAVTYACVLKACATIRAIDKGKKIHYEISRQPLLEHNIVLGNAVVDMYAKCGALLQAQSVLEKLSSRDIISWNTLIAGYVQNRQGKEALNCFQKMQGEGIPPDVVTYVCILKACAVMGAVDEGKKTHYEISRRGLLEHSVVLGNALVDMYAKCGALSQAELALEKLPSRNIICWSALIAGYAQNGKGQQALECFEQMQLEGISPDAVTYVCILKACALIEAIDKGKRIHSEILRQGFLSHDVVLGGALVDMYAKCGVLSLAQSVLEELPSRNAFLWNTLIAGYIQKGQGQQALQCFQQMQREGTSPDAVSYTCILKVCALIGAIHIGKQMHDEIRKQGFLEHDIVMGSALVEMYAKCGALCQAQSVLDKLPFRDVVSWNVLIAGYAQEGQGDEALKSFEQMQHEGILPDKFTFMCLLNLFSHLGLVRKGQELFDSMEAIYDLKPDAECFTCLVDLLGRAGHILQAIKIIQEMPCSANSAIWLCLLGSCWKWVDVKVGTWVFEQVKELDKHDGTAYGLMMNINAAAGLL